MNTTTSTNSDNYQVIFCPGLPQNWHVRTLESRARLLDSGPMTSETVVAVPAVPRRWPGPESGPPVDPSLSDQPACVPLLGAVPEPECGQSVAALAVCAPATVWN